MNIVKLYFENVFFPSHREVQWKEQWARNTWMFDFVLFSWGCNSDSSFLVWVKASTPWGIFHCPSDYLLASLSLLQWWPEGHLTGALSTCISVCLPSPAEFLNKEEGSCFAAQHLEGSCHRKVHLQLLCELILFFHHSQCTNSQKLCIFSVLHFLHL